MTSIVLAALLLAPSQTDERDRAFLITAGIATDGPALLAFLHDRYNTDIFDLTKPISRLGSASFSERERAVRDILVCGRSALPQLRKALDDHDGEIVRRARECIRILQKKENAFSPNVYIAALRQLAQLQPEGTVAALLAYLPHAPKGEIEEETWRSLETLAGKPGELHPLLAAALGDKSPARRALAANLAARLGNAKQKETVRRLLTDSEPVVRLRAAQGLLVTGESTGIPTLISLLETAPIELAWQAEELLHWLNEGQATMEVVGAGEMDKRRKCRASWHAWFKDKGAKVDVARLLKEPRRPGLYLIHEVDQMGENVVNDKPTIVSVHGCDGVPRWRLAHLPSIQDLNWDATGHLLLAESGDDDKGVVTRRNLQGKVVWKYEMAVNPFRCEPMLNGNVFITQAQGMREITPEKMDVFWHGLNEEERDGQFVGLERLPNGNMLYQSEDGRLLEYNSDSTRMQEITLDILKRSRFFNSINSISLHDGHFLAQDDSIDTLLEADLTGKIVRRFFWERDVRDAIRLPQGRLALGGGGVQDGRVERGLDLDHGYFMEIDEAGRASMEVFTDRGVLNIRSCFRLLRFGFPEPNFTTGDVTTLQHRLKGLSSPIMAVRRGTVKALQGMGHAALPAVTLLIPLLRDKEESVRDQVVQALMEFGPAAVPDLIGVLHDKNEFVRIGATQALSQIDRYTRLALPELLENLKDTNAAVRKETATALFQVGPEARLAETLLIERTQDPDSEVREQALIALTKLVPESRRALDAILKECQSKNEPTRIAAMDCLRQSTMQQDPVLPILIAALKEKNAKIRCSTALALAEWGPKAKAAVPSLIEAYTTMEGQPGRFVAQTRQAFNNALGSIGPVAPEIVTFVIERYKKTKDPQYLLLLKKLGPSAKDAIPYLVQVLDENARDRNHGRLLSTLVKLGPEGAKIIIRRLMDDPRGARRQDFVILLRAIAEMGPDGKEAVPRLIELLKDKRLGPHYQLEIISSLRQIGPDARRALPLLCADLYSDDDKVSEAAAHALVKIAPKDGAVLKEMCEVMRDANRSTNLRLTVCAAFSELGAGAQLLIPDILDLLDELGDLRQAQPRKPVSKNCLNQLEMLHDKDKVFHISEHTNIIETAPQANIVLTLAVLGKDAKAALPQLQQIVHEHKADINVRAYAACGLGRMGLEAKSAAPTLAAVLMTSEEPTELRRQAAIALTRMGSDGVAQLVKIVEGKDWTGQVMALTALEEMGPNAKEALPVIRALSRGDDKLLARAAESTLKRIAK